MKIEVGEHTPGHAPAIRPGPYDSFSRLEFICGIPHALFLVTTRREDGTPDADFHSWSSFSGDSGGFYAVMSGIGAQSRMHRNILREQEFCVNFIRPENCDACLRAIGGSGADVGGIAAGGFTAVPGITVRAPRILEAFLTLECGLHSVTDLSGRNVSLMVVGHVNHVAVETGYRGFDRVRGMDGFLFNARLPIALASPDPVRRIRM